MSDFNVEGFLKALEVNKPQTFNNASRKDGLEKVYLNFPDNFGKYQVLLMNSTVTGFPFVQLHDTYEVKVAREYTKADGTTEKYDTWIKLLKPEHYLMKDQEGRVVSSLTAQEQEELLKARLMWEQIFDLMGGNIRTPDGSKNPVNDILRRRQYTIFNAYCINKWKQSSPRDPERQNFSGLFICTAKGFGNAVHENINDVSIGFGGNTDWLTEVYNRNLTGRSGYLIFSVAMNVGGKVGYTIGVTHETGKGDYLKNIQIPEEDAALMTDPVETFLGYQAARNEATPGRLYNTNTIREAMAQMQNLFAQHNMGAGAMTPEQAAAVTSQTALMGAVAPEVVTSTDPMLAGAAQAPAGAPTNPAAVMGNNSNPFQNPPAAQIDPLSGQPVAPAATPGTGASPSFAPGNPFAN